MMKFDVKSMCICSLFTVLIAVGAFIKIPISIVPITLQTLFVVLAGMLLGRKLALISVSLYIIIGLIGIPIFANGGGIAYVLQPTFGYLIGFLLSSYIVGLLSERNRGFKSLLLISILGMLVIYLCGTIYFYGVQNLYYGLNFTMEWMFYYLFIVYLPGDLISCIIAVYIAMRMQKITSLKIR